MRVALGDLDLLDLRAESSGWRRPGSPWRRPRRRSRRSPASGSCGRCSCPRSSFRCVTSSPQRHQLRRSRPCIFRLQHALQVGAGGAVKAQPDRTRPPSPCRSCSRPGTPAGRGQAAASGRCRPRRCRCSAAFSLSTTSWYLGWSSSTYQSTSTTPAVLSKTVPDLPGDAHLALLGRPVDLGHQGLQHRRAGRHLGHLDARAEVAPRWAASCCAHLLGDLVALRFALVLAAAGSPGCRPRWRRGAGSSGAPGR